MRRLVFGLVPALLLVGCGSSSSQPSTTPTPVGPIATSHYTDHKLNFSFNYPRDWHVGVGKTTTIAGVPTYTLPVSIPGNDAQIAVTVDGQVIAFPPFTDGHVGTEASDPTHQFRFYHARTAGWPSMFIQRYAGAQLIAKNLSEVDTVTNTRHRSYDVKMLSGTPPFAPRSVAGYRVIARSLQVPFD